MPLSVAGSGSTSDVVAKNYNILRILPMQDWFKYRSRIDRDQPIWGNSVGAGAVTFTATSEAKDPGFEARVPDPPPNALDLAIQLLGLGAEFTEADVRTAYRKLAFAAHPDRGGDVKAFHAISEAKDFVLSWLKAEAVLSDSG